MKTYFGYIRVSTTKQGQLGVSLQEQRDAIVRYASSRGMTLSDWFEEQETAAKRGRPTFSKMLKKLQDGEASGVIIHKIDRSARNLKDWADLGEMIDAGVEVHFSNESLDLSSRGGRLSADIQAVVAADYIRNLREETKKGLYGRLKQGLYPWQAPLGYLDQGKGKAKIPDPEKAPLVRRAFELYATTSYDLKKLRKELNLLGLRNHRGGKLSINGVSKILRNPFYIGMIKVGSSGQVFNGIHQPLISVALFDRVQAILDGKLNSRSKKHDFLFRRFLTCKHCGRSLIGEMQKGHVYYRCHTKGCPTTSIREDVIEDQIEVELSPMQLDEDEFKELKEALGDLEGRWGDDRREMLTSLELTKLKLQERMNRLTDAFLDQVIDKEAFEERRATLIKEMREIEERMAQSCDDPASQIDVVAEFLEQAKSLQSVYIRALPYAKRDFLNGATSNRLVDGKSVEIQWNPPYEALADRRNLECCDHLRDRPRTIEKLIQTFVSMNSPTSPLPIFPQPKCQASEVDGQP